MNTVTGLITMHNAALAAATPVAFTLNNSTIGAGDMPQVSIASGATALTYDVGIDSSSSGVCSIVLRNYSLVSQSDAVVLKFNLFKGANS